MDYGFFVFPISSHLPLLTLIFKILFAALVLFQLMTFKKRICQITDLPFC